MAKTGSRKNAGWVPKQHGSWAMLLVPWIIGCVLAHRAGVLDLGRWLVGPAWVVGYLAFNSATLLVKAAPSRRGRLRPPLLTYGLLAAGLGGAAVLAGGVGVLWWAPVGALLVGVALWLTAHRRERSLLSGVVAVLAGTGVGTVARWWTPMSAWHGPAEHWLVMEVTVLYFIGTVLVVKTMIRERGERAWTMASTLYHVGLFALVGWAFGAGHLRIGWPLWAGLALLRAAMEPRWAGRLRPLHVGLVEIGLCLVLLVCVLV